MSHIKYEEGQEHPKNPKIRNYCKFNKFPILGSKNHILVKTNDRIIHEEKTIHWKPLPRELNYSPFQCPQLALIEKLFGYYGQQQKSSKKNKAQRDMFTKVGNEIRIGFIFLRGLVGQAD